MRLVVAALDYPATYRQVVAIEHQPKGPALDGFQISFREPYSDRCWKRLTIEAIDHRSNLTRVALRISKTELMQPIEFARRRVMTKGDLEGSLFRKHGHTHTSMIVREAAG